MDPESKRFNALRFRVRYATNTKHNREETVTTIGGFSSLVDFVKKHNATLISITRV